MRYLGSKNKLSKDIVPIIQKYIDGNNIENYFEPFVGGANIIDKIKCKNKFGNDIHTQLIELLKKSQTDFVFPEYISEEEYNKVKNNKSDYEDWYLGLIGFCSSFGAKYFGGYARNSKNDNSGSWSKGAITNLNKQRESLNEITFTNKSFLEFENLKGYVIYCDPPYKQTTKYKTDLFPYNEFYNWCKTLSNDNIVLISEYGMPDEFKTIWSKDVTTQINSGKTKNDNSTNRTEKMFICEKIKL